MTALAIGAEKVKMQLPAAQSLQRRRVDAARGRYPNPAVPYAGDFLFRKKQTPQPMKEQCKKRLHRFQ